ncbi:hypothetical protein [Fimbriiglobus ruber]|nr:hypothetical protein [Fimbriiglobus ruber]
MLLYEKADQAQALLAETGLDCWLAFARETDLHPDPGVEQVVGAGVVRNSAFLFGAGGERVAVVANFDTSAVRAKGVFREVIGYDEDIRDPLLRAAGTITSPLSLQSLAWLVASAGDHIMHPTPLHQCRCPDCLQATDHPNKEVHRQLNLLLSRLNEQQRRWLAAWEAQRIGHGGDRLVSSITGLHVQTIRRGRQELGSAFANLPPGRVRRPGAGRPPLEKKIRSWSETW